MEALKTAIVNGEEQRLKALLTNILFDELQKNYLITLAEHRGNPEIVGLLKGSPAKPYHLKDNSLQSIQSKSIARA